MDFRKYGIDYILEKGAPLKFIGREAVVQAQALTTRSMYLPATAARIDLQEIVGSGSYGNVYSTLYTSPTGPIAAAAKEIVIPPKYSKSGRANEYINGIAREAITNILLHKTCQEHGIMPFVPEVYQFFMSGEVIYIVQEKLDGTLHDYLQMRAAVQPDRKVPTAEMLSLIAQLADKLIFLQKHLQFNHRDLKTDNIMYKYAAKPTYKIVVPEDHIAYEVSAPISLYLIDFGFCCINYKGTQIVSRSVFAEGRPCHKVGRDLAQLLYSMYLMQNVLSVATMGFLRYCLNIRIGDITCSLPATCIVFGMRDWEDVYAFLDRDDVEYPRAVPVAVLRMISNYLIEKKGLPSASDDMLSLVAGPVAVPAGLQPMYVASPDNEGRKRKTQKKRGGG